MEFESDHLNPETGEAGFFSVAEIAAAWGVSKPTALGRARAEGWAFRKNERGGFEFHPPTEIRALLKPAKEPEMDAVLPHPARFVSAGAEAQKRAVVRKHAVERFTALTAGGMGREAALAAVSIEFSEGGHVFTTRTLRRWAEQHGRSGIDGLVDRKAGRVGRRGAEVPEAWAVKLQAAKLELGSAARAARHVMRDPNLPASMRAVLHEGHASKSYVNAAIRDAAHVAPLTEALAQGPRTARLKGRFTPGEYSAVKPGDVFVSDDMTCNVLCWTEWSSPQGWRIGQAQLLPILDCGSLRWLNFRLILRDGGQYNALDDICGVMGDVFDVFGLPNDGFLLEGGHWQAKAVQGVRTGVSGERRIGGLASLGLKSHRAYLPQTKGMIEGAFNQLQHEMDRHPGHAGRDQRTQLPEFIKKALALCKAGKAHPREFFPHISQLADHTRDAMARLNDERQDGVILRGRSPNEKWAEEPPRLRAIPDEAKWLYRSAMSVVKVTRNGIRVTQGSGAKMLTHYYDDPAALTPREGSLVRVYWNHANPETDAAVLDHASGEFICAAKAVRRLSRFGATDEELACEARRKAIAGAQARTELRSIQPELHRKAALVPTDGKARFIGRTLAQSVEAEVSEERVAKQTRREARKAVESTDSGDIAAMLDAVNGDGPRMTMSEEEIENLFSEEAHAKPRRTPREEEFSEEFTGFQND